MSVRTVLVIGCGSIGSRHVANICDLGIGEVLVHDVDRSRALALADRFPADAIDDLRDGFSRDPDLVLVATPPSSHIPLALRAIRRGCNVLIEKPLAAGRDQVSKLVEEVEQRDQVCAVACNMRFHPGPRTVHRLLEDGVVGEPLSARFHTGSYLPRWRPDQDWRESYSASPDQGGAVLDCIHELDLARWMLGPAELAHATVRPARTLDLETDGLAEIVLHHDEGPVSSVHLNFVQRDHHRAIHLIGSEGTIHWTQGQGRVDVVGPDGDIVATHPHPDDWEVNDMYVEEIEHFLETADAGGAPANPLREAAATLELALTAREGSP